MILTNPTRNPAHADKRSPVKDAPNYEIERRLRGYTYARNAVQTATPRYRWNLYLNGRLVDSDDSRAVLVSEARKDAYR